MNDEYKQQMIQEKAEQIDLKKDVRSAHFNLGNVQTAYKSTAKSMGTHEVTCEDVYKHNSYMKNRKDAMRKTNFKMPYIQDQSTEQSSYKVYISNLVKEDKLNPGKPPILSHLKNAALKV